MVPRDNAEAAGTFGDKDRTKDGMVDRNKLGETVGYEVGDEVGESVGVDVGKSVGDSVGSIWPPITIFG